MKKTLLLSVVASTMIMAGGDIAPVEPVVEAVVPMVEEASAWNFGGQAVAFTQTTDRNGEGGLFGDYSTYAAWGLQLSATNADIGYGVGTGVEVSGIVSSEGEGTGGFYGTGGNAGTTSGGITQAYLTYGITNTSFKVGRQQLPKSLSPFAFTEGWQMFKNSFDAALIVNSSLPNTTLVYAFVKNSNRSVGGYADEANFNKIAFGLGVDGAHMVTAQNKSFDNLTLTGTYYLAPSMTVLNDTDILWGDATYKADAFTVAIQGGQVSPDAAGTDSTSAFGAKIAGNVGMFNLHAAYTSVDDGTVGITNLGTGVKSPLYTQMVLNNVGQYHAAPGSDFFKIGASMKALSGKFILNYGAGTNDDVAAKGDFTEVDLMYKAQVTENIKFFAAYVYTDDDNAAGGAGGAPSENSFVRFWARYNFK